jgi:HlyD family secretion protein
VLKIEPQALTEQNVTMFPVLARIDNQEGLLRPGMNAEVEIHVGRREDVLAVPNAALRTQRDVGSAAQVLGLSPDAVQQELAQAGQPGSGAAGQDSLQQSSAGSEARNPAGRRSSAGFSGSRASRQPRGPASRYIVFVKRNGRPAPVWIQTGLTDMDYSEVLQGLSATDSVLVLPSASLVQSQQEMRDRFTRMTGGGAVPGMQQQTPQQTPQQPAGGARP